jgi:hypothetical protein
LFQIFTIPRARQQSHRFLCCDPRHIKLLTVNYDQVCEHLCLQPAQPPYLCEVEVLSPGVAQISLAQCGASVERGVIVFNNMCLFINEEGKEMTFNEGTDLSKEKGMGLLHKKTENIVPLSTTHQHYFFSSESIKLCLENIYRKCPRKTEGGCMPGLELRGRNFTKRSFIISVRMTNYKHFQRS